MALKKGLKDRIRSGLTKGLVAAALSTGIGCGLDSSIGSRKDINIHENPQITTVSDARNHLNSFTNNPDLEKKIDETINDFHKRSKPTSAPIGKISTYLEYDESNADFDGDHDVDFEDFFLFGDHFKTTPESPKWDPKYDLDGNEEVSFNDFFLFGDNFATTVNVAPSVDLESDKDEVEVGEEVKLSAFVDDKENDPVEIKWYEGSTELSEDGDNIVTKFDVAGEYDISAKAIDSFGSESEVASKRIVVKESDKLSLTLPDVIHVDQYRDGEEDGHVETVNLDEFVEDSKFSDSDLEWEVEFDGENKFERYHMLDKGWFGKEKISWYESEKIEVSKDGKNVSFDPGKDYNNPDYEGEFGKNFVNFKVKTPDGREASKKVEVVVDKHEEFDSVYDRSATERGYNTVDLTDAYVWMGNTWEHGNSRDPRTWTGRPITEAELEDFEWLIEEEVPRSSPLVPKLGYLYQNDWEKIYDAENDDITAPKGSVLLNIHKSTQIAGTISLPQPGKNYSSSWIIYNPDQDRYEPQDGEGIPREALLHEWAHVLGFSHPDNPTESDKDYVFSMWFGKNGKEYVPPLSEAIQRSRYE